MIKKVINAMLGMQRYSWEQGVAAQSLYEIGEYDLMINLAHAAVARQEKDGRLGVIGENFAVNDPAANGEAVYRAYEITKDEYFYNGAQKMLEYLMMYAPRTEDGVVFHNEVSFDKNFSNKQIWVDGCYMVPPFLAVMNEFTEATKQLAGYYNLLADEETGLFFHIYDYGKSKFIDKTLWATGNGWVLLGTGRLISEAVNQNNMELVNDLCEGGNHLLSAMLKYQRKNGLFNNIINNPNSFEDGTSAMMTAAYIYRGITESWLDGSFKANADLVYATMQDRIDNYGIIHGVCGAPDFMEEGFSTEAQAAFIMMTAWKEKAEKTI